ncbi:MAG: CNNM domain-containing protein [Xanthomonadales bacterium]|nr:CNNM domain-containing protein [Xanthomonadales bacterium]
MTLLILYVSLAIGVSFLCSIMEAVLLSVSPSYVAQAAREGRRTGRMLKQFKQDVDRPLAAILTLNTIAHTVGATGAGAQAIRVFGEEWIGLVSAVLTLLILFLSEIVPKTLGAVYWRELAAPTAMLLRATIWLLYPIVWVARGVTRLLTPKHKKPAVSRAELAALAELGAAQGVIADDESRLFLNLLRFRNVRTEEVMTPRVVIATLDESLKIPEAIEKEALRFSRIPLFRNGDRDDINGYVLKDEVLERAARGDDSRLGDLRRRMLVVPPSLTMPQLFRQMLDQGEQIALVADEYGDVEGLVTLEDVIEALLGLQIVDEVDEVVDMRELAERFRQMRAAKFRPEAPSEDDKTEKGG